MPLYRVTGLDSERKAIQGAEGQIEFVSLEYMLVLQVPPDMSQHEREKLFLLFKEAHKDLEPKRLMIMLPDTVRFLQISELLDERPVGADGKVVEDGGQ